MSTLPKITMAAFAKLADALVGLAYILGQPIPYNIAHALLKALDCSGLVGWLMYWSGNSKGDHTADGWYTMTVPVKAGQEKVGDLVFLRNNPAMPNGIGHVAILTKQLANGDWRIVEARGRKYGVVRTTLSYWKGRRYYAGVRRLPTFSLLPDPAGTPKPVSYPPTIRRGSTGKWVRRLQTKLGKLTVDGQFGPKTNLRVRAYQKAHKLTVDGVVGPRTWGSLGITL